MTNEEAIANYKYDRAIIFIRRIKTEETHEREVDRHKAFDLAISALEKQIPKKPIENGIGGYICPHCGGVILDFTHELYHKDCGGRLE